MRYKPYGNSNVDVSVVSFGAMRWPSEADCCEIVNHGMDRGLNYVDASTGYVFGKSLQWTGRAVKERRDEIYFSCKTGFAKAPSADEILKSVTESLKAAELEYFDFWQMWGLGSMEVLESAMAPGGTIEGVRKAMADGLIRHGLGFTFHGPEDVFHAAIDSGEFCAATVSYNLMKRSEEANIAYAGGKGVGVVIMNPNAGGVLALAGTDALDFLRDGDLGPACGAQRFLLANPNITTSIIGFLAVAEIDAAVAAGAGAGELDEAYRQRLIEQMDAVKLLEGDFCTGCGYCKECPNEFDPSRWMQVIRDFHVYRVGEERLVEWIYSRYPHNDIVADLAKCTECGECEDKCPQKLKITDDIRRGKAALGVE